MEGSQLVQSFYSSVLITMIELVAAVGMLVAAHVDDMLGGYVAVCLVICKCGFISSSKQASQISTTGLDTLPKVSPSKQEFQDPPGV